jgi:hypothetical protein
MAIGGKNPTRELFPFGFFQLPIDPELDASNGKQTEFGFGLARDDPVANTELPFPDARSGRGHGVFDALVNHYKNPAAAARPRPKFEIIT